MSEVKVNKITPRSGTSLQLGENGDTISVPAGATFNASAGTFTLPDGSVVEAKIANSAVTNDKLAGSIANSKLANSAITINGSSVSLGGSTTILTGTSWQSAIKTSTFTAAAGEGYFINTSGGAFEVDLPGSPSVGDVIEFVDFSRSFGTNALTLDPGSLKFQGNTSPKPIYDINGQSIRIVYSGTTQGWIPTSDDDVSLETPQFTTASFLVIAGGGGGGRAAGGGGGAGGYRNSYALETSGGNSSTESTLNLNPGTVYTIAVGGGGAGSPLGTQQNATNGVNSSIAGSDITNVVSTGGGGGGHSGSPGTAGSSGGSGGGGGAYQGAGGAGTSGQGMSGGAGSATSGGQQGAGGGGGASQNGGTGNSSEAGDGGDGLSSSITGSSVARGGGGGGKGYDNLPPGSGGTGGGGAGGAASSNAQGVNGTANTGGGGGGSHDVAGANGGSGVVILRMPTSRYTGTTSGSPSVSQSGSDTILVYNGDGSYTA